MSDSTQQNTLHSIEENMSLFTDDTATHCDFNIIGQNSDTENANDTDTHFTPKQPSIHSHHKHAYRNTFGGSNMFTLKLMNDTPMEIFIDNGATPSILPLCTYNKFPILHTYPKTESNTPIHTGGGLIKSHFWLEIPLQLEHQTIQIKALVCDSECPNDLILGCTSMAQLSALQD